MKSITLSIFKSSIIQKGMRILKVQQMGAKTADECMPFGEDSNPLKDMVAIFAETSVSGEPIILGYINKNQLDAVAVGEKRMYSLKEDGSLSSYVWLKNNGQVQLNGNTFSLVKYEPLETAVNQMDVSINTELTKIQQAISTLGGSYVRTNISTNISNAKAEDLKCK